MSEGKQFDKKNMIFRTLGNTGLRVPIFSYGGWLTVGYDHKGDIVKELMHAAWDAGINMFDTAEAYNAGESEKEMGRVLKESGWDRRDYIITTKIFFGTNRKETHNTRGLSRKHIIEGALESLKNLQLDYVDVIFAHRPDVTVPMEETVRAFNWLIDNNKAFYWGTSEWTSHQIQQATEIARRLNMVGPCAEQAHYSMLHRDNFETEYDPLWRWEGYGSTIWSPLEQGILTGKYNDGLPEGSRFAVNVQGASSEKAKFLQSDEGKAQLQKVRELTKIAEELGTNMSNLALAWAISNKNVSTCILGATKPEQIHENVKALEILPKFDAKLHERVEKILGNKPTPPAAYGRRDEQGNLI